MNGKIRDLTSECTEFTDMHHGFAKKDYSIKLTWQIKSLEFSINILDFVNKIILFIKFNFDFLINMRVSFSGCNRIEIKFCGVIDLMNNIDFE